MGRTLLEMRGDLRAPPRVSEEEGGCVVWLLGLGGRATGGTSPRPPQVRTYLPYRPTPPPHGRRDQRYPLPCAHFHTNILDSDPD